MPQAPIMEHSNDGNCLTDCAQGGNLGSFFIGARKKKVNTFSEISF